MATPAHARMVELLSRLPEEPADPADPLAALEEPAAKEPSAYVCSLASAFLLAPENALEEDVLRALFLQHARAEGVDGDAVLDAASAKLRAEGLIP